MSEPVYVFPRSGSSVPFPTAGSPTFLGVTGSYADPTTYINTQLLIGNLVLQDPFGGAGVSGSLDLTPPDDQIQEHAYVYPAAGLLTIPWPTAGSPEVLSSSGSYTEITAYVQQLLLDGTISTGEPFGGCGDNGLADRRSRIGIMQDDSYVASSHYLNFIGGAIIQEEGEWITIQFSGSQGPSGSVGPTGPSGSVGPPGPSGSQGPAGGYTPIEHGSSANVSDGQAALFLLTGGNRTATIISPSVGAQVIVKVNGDASGNTLTVDPASGGTIDGASNVVLTQSNEAVELLCIANDEVAEWAIVSRAFEPSSGPALSNSTPYVVSTAGDPGSSEEASRADHVHELEPASASGPGSMSADDWSKLASMAGPSDSTPLEASAAAGSAGTSEYLSRDDHVHQVLIGTPVDVGYANEEGVEDTLARSDHVHALPLDITCSTLRTTKSNVNSVMTAINAAVVMENPSGGQTIQLATFAGTPVAGLRFDNAGNIGVHPGAGSAVYVFDGLGSTIQARIQATGMRLGDGLAPNARLDVSGSNAALPVLRLKGASGQSADVLQIATDTGTADLLRVTAGGHLRRSVGSIIASTTQTQGNGPLSKDLNIVGTVANPNDTATLPSVEQCMDVIVVNNATTNQMRLYPASGDDLGNGANTAALLQPGEARRFVGLSSTLWTTPGIRRPFWSGAASTGRAQGSGPITPDTGLVVINDASTIGEGGPDCKTLPSAQPGMDLTIVNITSEDIELFPASGDDLGAGTNSPSTMSGNSTRRYIALDTTTWISIG